MGGTLLLIAQEASSREGFLQWPVMVFGWPAVLLSLSLSKVGIVRSKPVLLLAGAMVLVPFSFYLSANPYTFWALFLPLLPLAASLGVARGYRKLSWFLLSLAVAILIWLAIVVVGSHSGPPAGNAVPAKESGAGHL